MALIVAALLAPFPALASLDEPLAGLDDDDGDPTTDTFGVAPAFIGELPATGPRLDAPVGSVPLPVIAAQSAVEPDSGDEPSPRAPPRG